MNKIKVNVYKDPNGKGEFVNKTADFLQKAKVGVQVSSDDLKADILDQLSLTTDLDEIADTLSKKHGLPYMQILDSVEEVVDVLVNQDVNDTKNEMLSENDIIEEVPIKKEPLYSLNEDWESDNNEGWNDFDEEDELAAEEEAGLSLEKKGGTVNKKKFVKNIVNGLKKAAEGMEQDQSANSSILDIPIGGREARVKDFGRGIKNLGNEFYAKKIFDQTKQLQNEVRSLPAMPMAQEGMEIQQQDLENPMHHLQAYTGTVGNIFKEPMNQIHGAGYENLPEARRGREQRQADRAQRQMNKDWKNTFGDVAAGYFGVQGMPNYLQVISPQFVSPQANQQTDQQGPAGPLVDIQFKKGPWWSGKREWSAKGIPAEMLMGMSGGRGRGAMPGYGYMPGGYNYSSSWSTSRTFPGEIIRSSSRSINAAADPSKSNTNTGTTITGNTGTGTTGTGTTTNGTTTNTGASGTASTAGQILIYPGATDTYLVVMSDGALIQKIGNPKDPQADDPVKGRHTPEQAKTILSKLVPVGSQSGGDGSSIPSTNDSQVELSNNPENNSTAQNLAENMYEQSFVDKLIDPENKMHAGKYAFMHLQDPEEFKQGNFNNYYVTDPKTGQTYMSNNYNSAEAKDQVWNPVSLSPEQSGRLKYPIQHWDADPNNPEGAPIYNAEKTQWLGPDQWLQHEYDWYHKGTDNPFDQDKYYQTNYPDEYGKLVRAYGGPVNAPGMDQYGNLQKFIYGGGEDVSPIVSYEDNYVNSKNTEDPFMFRNGGLKKFEGEEDSQVDYTVTNPLDGQPVNQYQTPAFNRDNPNATATSNFAAYNEMKKRGLVTGGYDPTKSYDMSNMNNKTNVNTTTTNTQTQTQNQQGYNTSGGGYPTAPSVGQQILDKFMPFKRNKETGNYYDFVWASQQGPATTLDGKPYQPQGQPQGQPGAGQPIDQSKRGEYQKYVDWYSKDALPEGQSRAAQQSYDEWYKENYPQGSGQPNQGTQGQGTQQPGVRPAGYVYDYKMEKGPWWGGNKKTLSATARWYDPNNPNAGASANAGQFNNGKGPTLDAGNTNQPTTTTNKPVLGTGPIAPTQTVDNKGAQPNGTRYVPGMSIGENQLLKTNTDAQGNPMGIDSKGRLVGGDRKGFIDEVKDAYGNIKSMFSGKRYEYGGSALDRFVGGGINAGTGPFDPNGDTGIAGGGIGPCTEEQVLNAQPTDPCYNQNYSKAAPKDFQVKYDLKKARTLNTEAIGNDILGLEYLGQMGANAMNTIYNEDFLNDRTTGENRQPINYVDTRGGYSAQTQRIMSKTQGAGATGFNRVVGTDAFTRMGGQLKYKEGDVYDLSQEEIGKILAAGGQIKFIK